MPFRPLYDREGQPLIRLSITQLALVVVWVAVVSSLHYYPWIAAGVGALMIIVYLHDRSLGRTTPLAAFVFVFGTILSGFAGGMRFVIAEQKGNALVKQIARQDVITFIVAIVAIGLVLAAAVALITAFEKRHEWFNHLY